MKRKLCLLFYGLFLLVCANRSMAQLQVITTFAGNGSVSAGYSGDGGLATAALLNSPASVAADASGNVYIADYANHVVRKVAPSGVITTFAGTGASGYTGDNAAATAATLMGPSGLAVDGSGNVYIADASSNVVRKVSTTGTITTFAGTGTAGFSGDGSQATAAQISSAYGVATDASGNVYIADYGNHVVRRVNGAGFISTFAGTPMTGSYTGNGGAATAATLNGPTDVFADATGNVYIADNGNHVVRMVNTIGNISTVAGTGIAGYSGDGGMATNANMANPYGITVDGAGNIYVADQNNNAIRQITSSGMITTYAGGAFGYTGDGGLATDATLASPTDIALDGLGNKYIADFLSNTVRMLLPDNPPGFANGSPQSLVICQNSGPANLNSILAVIDSDVADTLSLTVSSAPIHGTLNGFGIDSVSAGDTITFSGLTYTPTTGYSGIDSFKISISDGVAFTIATVFVTVNPTPTVNDPADQVVCTGGTIAATNFSGSVSGTTYSWANNTTLIGLAATGTGNIGSFTGTNITNVPLVAVVTVTPTAAGCVGPTQTFSLTVNPVPDVVITPANQALCNASTTSAIAFTGAVSGTSYSWTNSNTSIGLAATGTGNIGAFTGVNTTTAPQTATVTVTPSANGCPGSAATTVITVYPTPVLTSSLTPPAICDSTQFFYISTSATSGTTYSWSRDTVVGISNSPFTGAGIINEYLDNDSSDPLIVVYMDTLRANGCVNVQAITVTVNPTPRLSSPVMAGFVCDSAQFLYVPTSATAGTTFIWSRPGVYGLDAPGLNGMDTIMEYLNDTTPLPLHVYYTYTLTANGCSDTEQVRIDVAPTAVLTSPVALSICNNTPFHYVSTSSTPLTFYNWSRPAVPGIANPPASGAADIYDTLINTTTDPIVVLYTDTLSAAGCSNVQYIVVTVNPTPMLTSTLDAGSVCDSSLFTYLPSSATTGVTYNWSRNSVLGIANPPLNGVDGISEFLDNTTDFPVSVTYTYSVTVDGCTNTEDVSVIVNPTPVLSSSLSTALCSGNVFDYTPTSVTPGATFSWSRAAVAGISNPAASGTGNISEVLMNTTPDPIVVLYVDTIWANGCMNTEYITVTVNPMPMLSSTLAPAAICDSTLFFYTATSLTAGTTFTWNRPAYAGIANAAQVGADTISEYLDNTTALPIPVTYSVTLTANGCTNFQLVTVTVNPTPMLSNPGPLAYICNGITFNYLAASGTPGASFAWSRAAVTGITPATSSGTGNISETLTNTTTAPVTVTYVFTVTANGCTNTQDLMLTINPLPNAPVITTATPGAVCLNTYFQNFGATVPPPAGIQYVWSATGAQLSDTGSTGQYVLVNFKTAGTATIRLSAVSIATGCSASATASVDVSTEMSDAPPSVIYFNESFICLQNNEDGYQWGYEDINTLEPTTVSGAVNQDWVTGYDDTKWNYWVMVSNHGCTQKAYFKKPAGALEKPAVQVSVYPNPVDNSVYLDLNEAVSGNMEAEVVNMVGQQVAHVPVTLSKTEISMANLPSGVYFINCFRNGAKISTSRVIKN